MPPRGLVMATALDKKIEMHDPFHTAPFGVLLHHATIALSPSLVDLETEPFDEWPPQGNVIREYALPIVRALRDNRFHGCFFQQLLERRIRQRNSCRL